MDLDGARSRVWDGATGQAPRGGCVDVGDGGGCGVLLAARSRVWDDSAQAVLDGDLGGVWGLGGGLVGLWLVERCLAFEALELGDDVVVDVDQVGDVGAGVGVASASLRGAVGDESGGGQEKQVEVGLGQGDGGGVGHGVVLSAGYEASGGARGWPRNLRGTSPREQRAGLR